MFLRVWDWLPQLRATVLTRHWSLYSGPPSPQPGLCDPKLSCHPNAVGPSYASHSLEFFKMLFQDRILDFHLWLRHSGIQSAHDLKSRPHFQITLYIDTSFYLTWCFKIIFKRQFLWSHVPLARKQRKPLLRGVLHFMTTEREHSSLIGTYVRVPLNRVSEIRSFGTRLFDNISEGRRTECKPQSFRCQNRTLPKLWAAEAFLRSFYSSSSRVLPWFGVRGVQDGPLVVFFVVMGVWCVLRWARQLTETPVRLRLESTGNETCIPARNGCFTVSTTITHLDFFLSDS